MKAIRMTRKEDLFPRKTLKETDTNTLTTLKAIFIALPILRETGQSMTMRTERL